jgi:hypothetical protein
MDEPMRTPAPRPTGGHKLLALLGTGLAVGLAVYLSGEPAPVAATPAAVAGQDAALLTPTAKAVAAAIAFLDGLTPDQRGQAVLDFGDAKKPNWSNLPVSFVPRNGVRLGDLTAAQRAKAMGVVAAVLSKEGYQKVVDIMDGDQRLADEEKGGKGKGDKGKGGKGAKGGGPMFGADQYYLALFGQPSPTKPWTVQFGGHHLGVNVTVVGKHFVLTPSHTGAQPALFQRDGKEVRPLGPETDAAFKLVNALDDRQRAQAVLGTRPQQELLVGPRRDGRAVEPKGIKGTALTADQQALLLDVIAAWVTIGEPEAAAARMAELKGQVGETHFAWSGPTAPGSAAYFRVQGPSVVIEYAPQGGTGHIHTVIRNPQDEYGSGSAKR